MPLKEANPRSINVQFSSSAVETPSTSYLIFYEDWCPDCRAVQNLLKRVFDREGAPLAQIVRVGEVSDWKSPQNIYRREWNLKSIPTIIRYDNGKESGKLVDNEITEESLVRFIAY